MYTGPKLTNDNLVFGYDTGYGVADNTTVTRFYPGEPTTNLYTNSDFSNGETGWTFGSWDGNITHTATTLIGPYGKTVSANKLTKNASSSYSHFHQYNQSKYASGNTYTTSAWVKGSGTFQIKSHWGGNTSFTMTGDWQRVSMTVTATSSSSSHFPYFAGESLTTGTVFYITMCQTELNPHATPYVYSGGTTGSRSDTASLIDLKKTRDVDVSNMSFDSDGQPELDGTDDDIDLGSDITFKENGGDWTVESIVKYDSVPASYNNSTAPGNFIGAGGISFNSWYWSVLSSKLALWNISPGVWKYGSTTLTANKFYHVVLTCSPGGTQYKMYLNGVQEGGTHADYAFNASYSGLKVRYFGRGNTSNPRLVNGKISVTKIYDTALTSAQIADNFNAYKNRFDIQ